MILDYAEKNKGKVNMTVQKDFDKAAVAVVGKAKDQ